MMLNYIPTSGSRGCHSLGCRARWQPSTHRWFSILAIVAWRTTFSIRTTARHTARVRERRNLRCRDRSVLGCQLGQVIPEKPYFQNKHGSINKCSHVRRRWQKPNFCQWRLRLGPLSGVREAQAIMEETGERLP